jgi:hypothetical protein
VDYIREWMRDHSTILLLLGTVVAGAGVVLRVRGLTRSIRAPRPILPELEIEPEPERPLPRVLWRLKQLRLKPRKLDSIRRRVAFFGLAYAAVLGIFSIPILIEVAFRGRYYACDRSTGDTCDWLAAALLNPVAGGFMGAIIGAGLPFMRRVWVAIPIGIVAAIPFVAQFALNNPRGLAGWRSGDTILVLAGSLFGGSILGYALWYRQVNDLDAS